MCWNTELSQEYIPSILKQREIFIPLIVGFYVIVLGLALTGALRVSKTQQDKVRKERGSQFSMLDQDEDDEGKESWSVMTALREGNERADIRISY